MRLPARDVVADPSLPLPLAVCPDGAVLRNPTENELARCIGMLDVGAEDAVYDVVIAGAGPAGLAAAVYACSEGLSVLVIDARAFGGDFISGDLKLVPDRAAMESGLNVLRGMFEAGSLPRSYATTTNDDQVTWLQQGRAAFTILPFARNAQLNNPEQSKYPGKIKAVEFPIAAALKGKKG